VLIWLAIPSKEAGRSASEREDVGIVGFVPMAETVDALGELNSFHI
jgi:hypothetical protein